MYTEFKVPALSNACSRGRGGKRPTVILLGYHVVFILLIINISSIQGVFAWDTGIFLFFCSEGTVEQEPPTYL